MSLKHRANFGQSRLNSPFLPLTREGLHQDRQKRCERAARNSADNGQS